jgi:hypothetical protein
MKRLLLSFGLLVFALSGFSQTKLEQHVISSQGGNTSNGVSLQYVVGETVVSQQANTSISVNIGFLQPQLRLVSIQEQDPLMSLKVYPNPCREKVFIESVIPESVDYYLFNENGQIVKKGKLTESMILPMINLTPGLYHLQLIQGKFSSTTSLIKT